ncbi:hypothetical protein GUJ93_ZPchr0012g19880 [Zizania palustris]|uniref:Uncharacterized protein n=1 Tax=Zizania palustris TaxID=103762 RepID=A0A8J5WRS0_ZIZPA|nr:hypothetical protein GUJ93_ZPchr0012g19880 [Zizania palustris]
MRLRRRREREMLVEKQEGCDQRTSSTVVGTWLVASLNAVVDAGIQGCDLARDLMPGGARWWEHTGGSTLELVVACDMCVCGVVWDTGSRRGGGSGSGHVGASGDLQHKHAGAVWDTGPCKGDSLRRDRM